MEAMNHLNVFAVDIPMIWSRLLRSRPGGELIPYHPDSFPYCIALQLEGLAGVNRISWEEEPGLFRSFGPKFNLLFFMKVSRGFFTPYCGGFAPNLERLATGLVSRETKPRPGNP